MGSLAAILKHPHDVYPLLKLKMAARIAEKQIPSEPHWGFCYSMLHKVSRSFALVIQQLGADLRNAVCIFYLVLRALDTVEDDTSIATYVKVPILVEFHKHVYDPDWHFSCGMKEYKVLMDQFHHVSTAFLELERGFQEGWVQEWQNLFARRWNQLMTLMNIATMWLDLLVWVCLSFFMPLAQKIWLLIIFPIQWVYFFRKQTSFEITWKTLTRYQNHVCSGPEKSGVNMSTNSREVSPHT